MEFEMQMQKMTGLVAAVMAAMACVGETAEAIVAEPGGLEGALEKAREARRSAASVEIVVRGVHRLTRPLTLTAADGGIVFAGERGATLSGGVRLTGWKDLGRGVWETEAPRTASGETAFFDQLWVNGRRAPCARLPDEGWLRIASATQYVASATSPRHVERVVFTNDAVRALDAVPKEDWPYLEVGVVRCWCYGLRSVGFWDPVRRELTTRTDFPKHDYSPWGPGSVQIAFFNVRSAFDAPGEWFLDMHAGKVRYRPLPGEDPNALDIEAPRPGLTALLRADGDWKGGRPVSDVAFRGISFVCAAAETPANRPQQLDQHQAAFGMDGMIRLEGAHRFVFDGCTFSHCAGHALRLHSGCLSNRVTSCRIVDPGAGGIVMGTDPEATKGRPPLRRKMLRPSEPYAVAFNVVSNCVITGGGRYDPEGIGVCLTHCSDTAVVHNDISDFLYSGVSVGWTWGYWGSVSQRNDIGFNRIWDLGKGLMCDLGGVYTLGTSFGTRIHDNVIHDVECFEGGYGGWGLYCDQGSEGIVEENNLCWNTTDGGFNMNYGSGCIVRNNIFAFNRAKGFVVVGNQVYEDIPTMLHFVNNICLGESGPMVGVRVHNKAGVWANNVWFDRRGRDRALFDKWAWEEWTERRRETGSVFADPLFADADGHDFTLKPGSPALKLGFRPFDPSKAGARLAKENGTCK